MLKLLVPQICHSLFLLILMAISPAQARTYSYAIIGDAGVKNDATQAIQDSIFNSGIKDLILPGDNLYDPKQGYEFVWDAWKKRGFNFNVVAIGNHTLGFELERQYFAMPAEFFKKEIEPGFKFLVLNSENQSNIEEQMNWLDAELRAASTDDLVLIVSHHPSFTLTSRHTWQEREAFQLKFRTLLQKHSAKIDGIFYGHDHIATAFSINDIPAIVSGATFQQYQFPGVNYTDGNFKIKTEWMYKGEVTWIRMDVDTVTKEVWINFVNARKSTVDCSMRMHPLPILKKENCGKQTSSKKYPELNPISLLFNTWH